MDKDILSYLTERCSYLKWGKCTTAACLYRGRICPPLCIVSMIYNKLCRLERIDKGLSEGYDELKISKELRQIEREESSE